jgi:hypothetical protein
MPTNGHRHQLILYTYMINRWWRAIFAIGLCLMILAGGLIVLPRFLPQYQFLSVPNWNFWALAGTGGFLILIAFLLVSFRKAAYVQPLATRLHLVTPFLRMDISYQRILKTTSTEMKALFPSARINGWQRNLLHPLSGRTAIVLEMNGWPLPRAALRLFLSPFFFPDRSARLALLVPDWIKFSTELESFRGVWRESVRATIRTPQSELFHSIIDQKRK